ncbi:hypothetical protein [Arthrobacter sp. 35/47]|uniref:hypothetical protein n=1 Tax=Arthrobacter sp. 35/47 TaxID=269454 RepID=UPI00047BE001|nr:hypothetical protein [Arthrobacter sp. 35/47]
MVKALIIAAAAALLLSGCGAVAVPGGNAGSDPPSRSEELIGQGTVISDGDGMARLCLGAVMESYPPQCSGPEIIGWDWTAVDQSETAAGVTWGTYAVQGTWDGTAFTLTQPPVPLALYDPPATIDPRTDPANPGAGSEAQLEALQQELAGAEPGGVLMSWVENGHLFITVEYDDGTLQSTYDARYGPDIVAVQSALRPVGQ